LILPYLHTYIKSNLWTTLGNLIIALVRIQCLGKYRSCILVISTLRVICYICLGSMVRIVKKVQITIFPGCTIVRFLRALRVPQSYINRDSILSPKSCKGLLVTLCKFRVICYIYLGSNRLHVIYFFPVWW